MDTGTFYLYEYENNVRKRNAGFLKIYRRYQSCIFQAHIRSISLENVFEAEMYAFFFKENQICAKQIAHFPIDSMTHVSALRNLPSPNAAVSNRSTGFS
jgi:hypothetical protein